MSYIWGTKHPINRGVRWYEKRGTKEEWRLALAIMLIFNFIMGIYIFSHSILFSLVFFSLSLACWWLLKQI